MPTYNKNDVSLLIDGKTIKPYDDDTAQIDALTTGASLDGGCDVSVGYYAGSGRVKIDIGGQAFNTSAEEARRLAKTLVECADLSEVKK